MLDTVKLIVKGRGEGKTQALVEQYIDVVEMGYTNNIFVGSYNMYGHFCRTYESIMNQRCPIRYSPYIPETKFWSEDHLNIFMDELTKSLSILLANAPEIDIVRWDKVNWYITIDKSYIE